jgi:hypothetical protein
MVSEQVIFVICVRTRFPLVLRYRFDKGAQAVQGVVLLAGGVSAAVGTS